MSLELWGAIAASFLLLQCILFNLIWVALAAALWKGAEWAHRNGGVALDRAGELLARGQGYVEMGERYLASPFVRLRGRAAGVRALLSRVKG